MYIDTLNISPKGQIILPKKIRNILKTNVISLEINDHNQILLSPLRDLSGSLADYKKNTTLSFREIREQAWQENTIKSRVLK
ncbi:AbrB/MazE/SpoVT family DNA-binding domain-containing protein [Rickettsia sp. TH2014]|uniref:AbrB/MazE/SpoVT family DNA-binding domain-containing protein n=1 Tax=Rickettsia sp. TH2014 TaxID=1967503 RepID=UPI001C495282|nr:AbrB/MazE/SpoVT family DNA-binding domain-containing protein [Rickettsia sp. TH2014]